MTKVQNCVLNDFNEGKNSNPIPKNDIIVIKIMDISKTVNSKMLIMYIETIYFIARYAFI